MPVIFARIDDPEQNRLRRMMTRDFTWRRCETMLPEIRELVDRFLDTMIEGGPPADLVRDFALPVPSLVISMLLGVPYSDHEFFQHHSTVGLDSRSTDEQKAAAIGAMFGYIFELVERKEREPGDDLISRLITEYVASSELSHETAAMNAMILLQAGHETTASMIALGTIALLENPDIFGLLGQTDDAAVTANIVEELMRYLTIVHSQVDRVATEDFSLRGESNRAGDFLLMNLPAENWDPEFVADPASLDAARNTCGHLGFGYGVHKCIGQNLARVEMQVALSTLARRLPGLALAVAADELRFQNEQKSLASRNSRSRSEGRRGTIRDMTAQQTGQGIVTVTEAGTGTYTQQITAGPHQLVADEPKPIGDDAGPTPYDLLLAALGSCTSMTVRMYADHKGWPVQRVRVTLRHSRIHAKDCAECETTVGWIDQIDRDIELTGELDDTQRQRLLQIAERCPVHQTLKSEVHITTSLS